MNNKESFNKNVITWVLVGLFFLLGLFLVFHFISFSNSSSDLFAKRVQKAVLNRETELSDAKESVISRVIEINEHTSPNTFESLTKDGIGLYVFHEDSLVFWNSNTLEPKLLRKRVKIDCDTILNLGFGDYLVTSGSNEGFSFYLFSLLNTTYPIENKYFINSGSRLSRDE